VSATLGSDQLHAGLLAGAIGLVAVIIYSFIYYRGLGLVTVSSLAVAGLLTYATVVLLGHTISYTLTLAGIAGLIVAIGITADSFIVYFERLRDEVREGRTLRSAVERGWARAFRTIVTADFVSLLAAGVLYVLSIGSVRGFAFTLGLSTIIDLVVVVIFTKPLVTLLVNSRMFGSQRPWTGLSPDRLGVTAIRAEPERRSRRVPRTGEV
jgi:preprotein translocase subunit SecD